MKNYKYFSNLENVYSFSTSNDLLVYFDNVSSEIFANKSLQNVWRRQFPNFAVVKIYNENIYIADGYDTENLLFDLNGNIIENLSSKGISIDFHSTEFNNLFKFNSKKGFLGLYNLTNKSIIWEKPIKVKSTSYLNNNFIACASRDNTGIIIVLELNTGETLWQFSVSELGKRKWVNGSETIEEDGAVSKIIGVMGEVLVVVITGGGDRDRARTQLIGLHTQTGELCWLLDGFEHEGITYPHLPTTATLMPDAQNEFLVGFQNRYFIEIDPQVGKVTRCRKIDDQCQIHNLATIMDSFSLQGDYLYFRTSVSSMGGFPTAIGAFNYKTEEIEWRHVFEEFATEGKFIPINQPKAEGNRVYALDSGSTLHIFERE